MAEIVAVARFDTSEFAYFSKNYVAYVLDEAAQEVKEVKANELTEGDVVIFTRSNEKARDIVDELLNQMLSEERLPEHVVEAYRRSKEWKNALAEHMEKTTQTPSQIAQAMVKNGLSLQENTIKGWLDEESHTVGPRSVESIRHIAVFTGNDRLLEDADVIFNACGTIRGIRRRIMSAIAKTVLGSITGENLSDDPLSASVSEHIDELATVLRIESIRIEDETVPGSLINRPLSMP